MPNTDLDTTMLLAKIAALEQLVEEYERSVFEQAEKLQEKEEVLRLYATQMATIMDTSLDAIIVMDSQGVIFDWNTQATNIFGWQKHDVLGRTVAETIIPPKHREAHQRGLRRFLATGEGTILNQRIDITALHRTGREFPVELAITATKINERWQFAAFMMDTTERKQTALRLAAQYAVTQVLAESPTLQEAGTKILQMLCECFDWEVGGIWRVDSEANLLRCLEIWHAPKTEAVEFVTASRRLTFAPGIGMPGRVWSRGKPAWIPDVLRDPNFPRAPVAAKAGLHGAVGFPIKIGKNVYGIVEFFSREICEPDHDLLQMVSDIGIKIGQFIERKRTEEMLRTSEARLNLIARSTKDLLWDWNPTTDELWWNESLQTVLGYRAEEIERGIASWTNRVHPDDLERVESSVHAVLDSGENEWSNEYRFRSADGSYNYFLDRGCITRDDQGKPARMLGTMVNITERRQAEESLSQLAAIVNSSEDAIVSKSLDGIVVSWNKGAEHLLGYTAQEMIGKTMARLIPPDHIEEETKIIEDIKQGKHIEHLETVRLRKDGRTVNVSLAISPIQNTAGEVIGISKIARDITQRKQLEAQAGELERLTTMSQLTDGIAHEMKNPLFILTGRLQMVKEKLDHREYGALPDDLQKIESAAARMTHIADRFSRLAQHTDLMPEPTAVQTVLKRALELLSDDMAKNRIAVTTALAPDLPAIQANPLKLQTAFTNLIRNALQAMAAAHGKGNLTVTAALQGGWIEVRIKDDGPGIAPEHRTRLFEPFFTTKPAGQGVGMGLWAVRATAMALRGTVACETDVENGATFIMRLPVVNTRERP